MDKFTPGPWRVTRRIPSPITSEWVIAGAKPGYLAEVHDCGSGDVQADARLIAAAPELLGALRQIVEYWDSIVPTDCVSEMHAKAHAAIAKATGEQK
jgi:hypothetical protein